MTIFRRFLSLAPLFLMAGVAGCSLLSGGGGDGVSHTSRGGFTVVADSPGAPSSTTVVADIGAFAQKRGFARQPGGTGVDRYLAGGVILEVSRLPEQHRVSAYLHNNGGGNEEKFISQFYRDFARENAGRYGGGGRISETAYADDRDHGESLFGKPVEANQTAGRAFGNGR